MTTESTGAPPVRASAPDPRPQLGERDGAATVHGTRCTACAHPSLEPVDRCPVCHGPSRPTTFPGSGTVFSSTVLHIPVGDLVPPTTLLYVDLDHGPRLLGHAAGDQVVAPGTRVLLTGRSAHGDPTFALTEAPS